VPARLGLIAALQEAGEVAAALELARDAVLDAPEEPRFLLALGQCARLAGDRDAARAAFQAAAERLPQDPQPLVEAAVEERALDDPAASLALLRRALAIDPAHVPVLEHLAAHHRIAGDLPAALASFEAGIATGRPGPWCYLGAAEILAEQSRLPAALALLEEGSRALPAVPEIPAKRLELMRRSGAIAEALALARAMPAGRFAPWFEQVVLEHQSGDPAVAAALLAAPPPAATLAERARTEHLRGLVAADHWDLATAEAHLARASALAPDDPWPRARLAMARLARFDLPGARVELAAQVRLNAAAARLQGRVARVSQTFHGQILDDLALEPALVARLAALAAQPAAARIEPLLGLVREMPDHFGSAYALMIALRQSGGFAPARGPATPPPIPPRLAQYWDGAEVPEDVAALMASWAERCPDFTITRFDDASALEWLRATQQGAVVAAWRRLRDATQRADLLRLAVLAAEGGWWADADDRLFGSLGPLAPSGTALALYQEDFGSIGNNLIGAAPGHPVLALALRLAVEGVNRGDADTVWLRTGPGLITRTLAMHLAARPRPGMPAGILVHDHLAVGRQVALHCLAEYKVTRHWMRPAQRVAPPRNAAIPEARPAG
jgi:tetratricopeptide (TPR) repeat protein